MVGGLVEGVGTKALDGINAENYPGLLAKLAQFFQIKTGAAGILDGADGEHPASVSKVAGDLLLDVFSTQGQLFDPHALAGQRLPDNAVGWELFIADEDFVTCLPC